MQPHEDSDEPKSHEGGSGDDRPDRQSPDAADAMPAGAATPKFHAEPHQQACCNDEVNRGTESGCWGARYCMEQRRSQDQAKDKEYRPEVAGGRFDAGKQDATDTGDPADADHQHHRGEADHQATAESVKVGFHRLQYFKILEKPKIWVFNHGIKAFR